MNGMHINGNGPQIVLAEMENLKCDHCGCIYFIEVKVIKVIPRLFIGATEDQHEVLNALRCVECGYVPGHEKLEPQPKKE